MQGLFCTLLSLLLSVAPMTVTVSGRILDRSGKPASNAKVVYANPSAGRTYTGTTDVKGQFEISGVLPGSYQVTITDEAGKPIFSEKEDVWRGADDKADPDSRAANFLVIDLSKAPQGASASAGGNTSQGQGNASPADANRLIADLHTQLNAQDWPHAAETLQRLIKLDPNRWEFYQNLGAIQNNLSHYEEAAQAFAKGVEVAGKTMDHAPDLTKAQADIGGMMLAEGDAYNRLDKLDQAIAVYKQAASILPQPAAAYYRACAAQNSHGNSAAAIDACNQAIAADPNQWEYYQPLAGAQILAGKNYEALQTYDRGIEVARKVLAAQPGSTQARLGLGQMLTAEGNLHAQMKNYDQAIAAFNEAATATVYPALPYYDLCATYYNIARMEDAITTCDKAIAADPKMADAYYIKGSALFGKGRLEYGKYVAPPQTRESLNAYLGLSPSGTHAQAVREMLEKLGPEMQAGKHGKKK